MKERKKNRKERREKGRGRARSWWIWQTRSLSISFLRTRLLPSCRGPCTMHWTSWGHVVWGPVGEGQRQACLWDGHLASRPAATSLPMKLNHHQVNILPCNCWRYSTLGEGAEDATSLPTHPSPCSSSPRSCTRPAKHLQCVTVVLLRQHPAYPVLLTLSSRSFSSELTGPQSSHTAAYPSSPSLLLKVNLAC